MATQNFLFLIITLSFTFITAQSRIHPASTQNVLILPLKAQNSKHIASSSNKLFFQHNVTLTVSLRVGSPPQDVTMVLDTGSELPYLHCKKTPEFPLTFNSQSSSTYSPIPCSSPTCTNRTRDLSVPVSCDAKKLCHATLSYADASSIEGSLASDTFLLGSSALQGIVFGCMDSGSTSNEEDAKTTGLLGMNLGTLSLVNQMGLPQFSYCISGMDSSGVLIFGDASFPWLSSLNYTPLIRKSDPLPSFDRVAYTVQPEGIKVSGKALKLPKSAFVPDHTGAGQTMLDSGTQFSFLLGEVYTALKNEFVSQTKGLLTLLNEPNFVFQGAMDLCYRVPETVPNYAKLPIVTIMFQGAELSVSGERLLYRVPGEVRGSDSVYCFTFGNSELLGIEAFIIGHYHQQNIWMQYDLVKSRVGLAEVKCDLASKKLGLIS